MSTLVFTFLAAGAAFSGSATKPLEKSTMALQQAATIQTKPIPPLDASPPAQVETLTFGLG